LARSEGCDGTRCTTKKSAMPTLFADLPRKRQRARPLLPFNLQRRHNLRHIRPVYFRNGPRGMRTVRGITGTTCLSQLAFGALRRTVRPPAPYRA
jgi:hypothetical protein